MLHDKRQEMEIITLKIPLNYLKCFYGLHKCTVSSVLIYTDI